MPDHGLVHLISDEVIKSRGGSYALDAIVIIVSILSMLLCSRSVFRAQQLRIVSTYIKTYVKQPLKNKQNKDHNDKWVLQNAPLGAFCKTFDLH